ncbi:hypothetical protein LJB99_03820 [Deltaproteobacteria bacterium OttesenSCG-928-K17]|nr:hypothetical protein [Deltaproteobacteria bacterium OttesenSCG-928-K17]
MKIKVMGTSNPFPAAMHKPPHICGGALPFRSIAIIALALIFWPASLALADGKIGPGCTFNGKRLYGKVQVVGSLGDIKVRQVSSMPDLRVQKVSSMATDCGQWEFVNVLSDFTVEFVDVLEDFSIQFVDNFPGQ